MTEDIGQERNNILLKRVWDTTGSEPRLIGVKFLHGGLRQKFSPRIIERALAEGWLELSDNMVRLRTDPPATYRIIRTPGYYCCFCNKPLNDSSSAVAHLESEHSKMKSPDPFNPSGYRRDNFYYCVRQKNKEV